MAYCKALYQNLPRRTGKTPRRVPDRKVGVPNEIRKGKQKERKGKEKTEKERKGKKRKGKKRKEKKRKEKKRKEKERKGKERKAIPLQACTGPEGSRRLRIPDFKTIGT